MKKFKNIFDDSYAKLKTWHLSRQIFCKGATIMKYGIFGCTADPFTLAHKAIVEKVLSENLVDKVIILPTIVTYYRPGKQPWLLDSEKLYCIHRMLMNSEFKDRIIVSAYELNLKGILSEADLKTRRSLHMVESMKFEYGHNNEFYFILGTDSLENFKTWYCWKQLLKEVKLIAVQGRDDKYIETDIPYTEIKIDKKYSNISASKIREKYSMLDDYLKSVE